jgi:hypothetical protein
VADIKKKLFVYSILAKSSNNSSLKGWRGMFKEFSADLDIYFYCTFLRLYHLVLNLALAAL